MFKGKVIWIEKKTLPETLDFVFVLDEILTKYETKPLDYIAYLFKYSGEGSLFRNLKNQKLATKVDTGIITNTNSFSQFLISITLTKQGIEKVLNVIQITYAYMERVRNEKISKEIYDEISKISQIQFKFLEKRTEPGDYLSTLAGSMFDYPANHILSGDYIHSKFDENIILKYLNGFTLENCLIFIGTDKTPSKNLLETFFLNTSFQVEKWYKTKYIENKISKQLSDLIKSNAKEVSFKIRAKNEYITNKNELLKCSSEDNKSKVCDKTLLNPVPNKFLDSDNFKVWFKVFILFIYDINRLIKLFIFRKSIYIFQWLMIC